MKYFDAIVIGTGFGGAVAASRLVEAGLSVCVLERGRRYGEDDFPELPAPPQRLPDPERWTYRGAQASHGLWDVRDLGDVRTVQAAGYGGGSLIYANVHLRAEPESFDARWPSSFSRESLDPYYDLVAYSLDVAPSPSDAIPTKSARFRASASALGRDAEVFAPPLAVRFGDPNVATENRFGVPQPGCNSCGRCNVGCTHGAKSSLDRTYLATVDRAAARGDGRVVVRTMAEVVGLARRTEGAGYVVRYRDHLTAMHGSEPNLVEVEGARVFLAAGAVASTELLLRNRASLGLPRELPIGQDFHTNADALGVVFDAKSPHHAFDGPTITTSLVHRELRDDGTTRLVLVQEGGFPRGVEAAFSTAFRSPALLATNRFAEGPLDGVSEIADAPCARPRDSIDRHRGGHPIANPVDGLLDGLQSIDPRAFLPKDVALVLDATHRSMRAMAERELASIVGRVLDAVATRHAERLARWLTFGMKPKALVAGLGRIVRRIVALLAGGESWITRRAVSALESQLTIDDPARFAARAIGSLTAETALDGSAREDLEHRAELLCMGTDDAAAVLELEATRIPGLPPRLVARRSAGANAAVESLELRLLRDFARTYGGELRAEPIHLHARKPITVHAQGGLAIGRVTDANGKVLGTSGLFVVDGSLMPTSIGVNPSATIAALAERVTEGAIRETLGESSWRAADFERARAWAESRRDMLDPLASTRGRISTPPRSERIGLAFDERMRGFLAPVAGDARDEPLPLRAQRAEMRGREQNGRFELSFTTHTEDLDAFLRGPEHRFRIEHGRHGPCVVTVDLPHLALAGSFTAEGSLLIFHAERDHASRLRYRIRFEAEGKSYRIDAEKWLGDGSGPSPMSEGSALHVVLTCEGREVAVGTVRLAASDFLGGVLPSMQALGTDDPVQRALAVSRFLAFFGSSFLGVYAPLVPLSRPTLASMNAPRSRDATTSAEMMS